MKKISLTVLLGIFLTLFACQKEFTPDTKNIESQIYLDQIITEAVLSGIQITDNSFSTNDFLFAKCANAINFYNKQKHSLSTVLTFYGNCQDNINRDGQILYSWNKGWKLGLTKKDLIINFNGYTVNDIIVKGQLSVKFQGFTDQQTPVYSIKSKNLVLRFPDKTEISATIDEKLEFEAGFYTLSSKDDILKVNYKTKGSDRSGEKFIAVAHDLVFNTRTGAFLPTAGTKVIQSGNNELIYNFGDGYPDNKFTLTKNDQAEELTWSFK